MLFYILLSVAVVAVVFAIYSWLTINKNYFKDRNIKWLKVEFTLKYMTISPIDLVKELYNKYPEEPFMGIFAFRQPQLIVRDPNVVKQMAVKDFDHFENHSGIFDEYNDPILSNLLVSLRGKKWRDARATLSPLFTGSKMRHMFELVSECGDEIAKHFLNEAKAGKKINVEMKDFFSRYTNDVIATCAFGIKTNSFANPENEFFVTGKRFTDINGLQLIIQTIKTILIIQLPKLAKKLKLQLLDPKVINLFRSIIVNTMNIRKSENIIRPDMINLLMQLREGTLKQHAVEKSTETNEGFATVGESEIGRALVNRTWSDNEIVAQCFQFFAAGFEPTSMILTFAAYELVANPDIQQKLYDEIVENNELMGGKRIDYESLQKMKYLDQVVSEVLRKWPPAVQTDRQCGKNYFYNDGDEHKFIIEKGKTLLIPVAGFHYDPKYFPKPNRFDPERFNDENKHNIIPGTYIPFGVGPRNCIGSRFALMEIKAILYYLLLNFSFEINDKTQIPIRLIKSPVKLGVENGMHIELRPRKN